MTIRARLGKKTILLAALALLFLSQGCCRHMAYSARQKPMMLPAEVATEFNGVKVAETIVNEAGVAIADDYLQLRYELSALTNGSATNRPLVLECFLPMRPGENPLSLWERDRVRADLQKTTETNKAPPVVVILPMLGGSYPLEKFFAKYFAKHGLASIIVHRENHKTTPVSAEELNHLFRQTVFDNKRAIDWLETRPEIDASRLGVFGISMGAIKGALLTPLEPRVDAAVLAMPAGDLPYVLAYTTERGIARRRAQLLKEKGLTEKELRLSLEKGITCDPIRFAKYVDPEKVMLVLAACDSTVPIKKGLELRAAMGKPETIVVGAGHYTAALYLPYLRYQSARFLKERLLKEESKSVGAVAVPSPSGRGPG